jgi:hypothetical protein
LSNVGIRAMTSWCVGAALLMVVLVGMEWLRS